jgi:hypothetical protein
MLSFSRGQQNILEVFQIEDSTALITKIALKTFLDFVGQKTWKNHYLAA